MPKTISCRAIAPLAVLILTACSKISGGASGDAAASAAASGPAASGSAAPTLAAGASGATTVSGFEGDIEMHISGARLPQVFDITYEVKGNDMRVDMPAMGGVQVWELIDRTANKMYTVMDAQKMVMVSDLSAATAAAQAHAGAGPKSAYTIDKTGKTDTVAGQSCEIWNVTGNGTKTELCVVKGVNALPSGQLAKTPGADFGWASGLESEGVMPLRAIVTDATGKETMRMEAVKFQKQTLDAARFKVPDGYRTMNMPAMGGAMPIP